MKFVFNGKKERRKKKRFPVLTDLDIPVTLQIPGREDVEGILLNLSASGIGLISFSQMQKGLRIKLTLKLNQLTANNLKGRIIWTREHKDASRIGIEFTKMNHKLAAEINAIAEDFVDCEIKITLGAKDICFPECRYYSFCRKNIKI